MKENCTLTTLNDGKISSSRPYEGENDEKWSKNGQGCSSGP